MQQLVIQVYLIKESDGTINWVTGAGLITSAIALLFGIARVVMLLADTSEKIENVALSPKQSGPSFIEVSIENAA